MESGLKQRLLGAAVLIALAVIFVPMFLSGPPPKQNNETVNLDIPAAPERKFETRTLPLAVPNTPPSSPSAGTTPPSAGAGNPTLNGDGTHLPSVDTNAPPHGDAGSDAGQPARPASLPAPASTAVPAAHTPPSSTPATPPPTEAGRFTVNLGIYADRGHADTLIQNVKKLGLNVFAESTDYQGKPAQRIRVGPFADRASAEAARLKVKTYDAKLPVSISEATAPVPASDAPATALPAGRAGGWAVQLGAFKSEDEANKLRERCRGAGFAAFVDRSGAGDQGLWRVRAGPEADRANADKLRGAVKQKLQLDGIVVTQP